MNASRPSDHPPVRGGGNVKTFRWDHRLQRQNLFVVFNRVPPTCRLYPPGVWFADVMASFSGVTFVVFCFVFVFMLSLKPRPFVQSSFNTYAGAPIIATSVFFFWGGGGSFCLFVFGDVSFSEYFLYHCRFLFEWKVRRTFFPSDRMVFFYLVTTGWIFYISLFKEKSEHT